MNLMPALPLTVTPPAHSLLEQARANQGCGRGGTRGNENVMSGGVFHWQLLGKKRKDFEREGREERKEGSNITSIQHGSEVTSMEIDGRRYT